MSNAANIAVPALCTKKMLTNTVQSYLPLSTLVLLCSVFLFSPISPMTESLSSLSSSLHLHFYTLVLSIVAATTFLSSGFLCNLSFQLFICDLLGVHSSISSVKFVSFLLYLNTLLLLFKMYNFVNII